MQAAGSAADAFGEEGGCAFNAGFGGRCEDFAKY
jgi:hypothetical protein